MSRRLSLARRAVLENGAETAALQVVFTYIPVSVHAGRQ